MPTTHELTRHSARGDGIFDVAKPRAKPKPKSKPNATKKKTSKQAAPDQRDVARRPLQLSNKQRINMKLHNLTLDVNALKQELRDLAVRRSLMQTRALYTQHAPDGSVMMKAAHYFSVFRTGYRSSEYVQPQYVGAIMAPDFSMGVTGLGTDMLLEQWRRYTDYFAIRYFTTPAMSLVVDDAEQTCILRATSQFRGVLTRRALQMVFPAVLRDPDLTYRLLGKEIVAPVLFHLHFNRDGRVTRHDVEVDFLVVLATVLQNSVCAAGIMEEAKVAEESMVEAVDDNARTTALEPVEQLARTKRVRVATIESICSSGGSRASCDVPSDEERSRAGDERDVFQHVISKEDALGDASPTSPSMEWDDGAPEEEPPLLKCDGDWDDRDASRHSVAFLLS